MQKNFINLLLASFLIFVSACYKTVSDTSTQTAAKSSSESINEVALSETNSPEINKILESLAEQTKITKNYDSNYVVISYPNGDVPPETGVCSDVVIRAFRAAGVDLQKEIHEDMKENFSVYPNKWNLLKPDPNIDHRRVLNLQKFFERKGKSQTVTRKAENYIPGDVVSWNLNGKGMTHIGIVSDMFNKETGHFLIIHNIGEGAKAEDVLFEWEITGHFRYFK